MSESLQAIVASELGKLGLELFELHEKGLKGRPVLDVRIERKDAGRVTVDDCARASRALEVRLDQEGNLGGNYVLEVSSPGLERPLRNAADWRRHTGRDAAITLEKHAVANTSLSGREVRIRGVEGDDGAEVLVLESGGSLHRVPLSEVRKARLTFNWKR